MNLRHHTPSRIKPACAAPIDRQGMPACRAKEGQQHGATGQRCVDRVPGRPEGPATAKRSRSQTRGLHTSRLPRGADQL
jgi:hypothetical protein